MEMPSDSSSPAWVAMILLRTSTEVFTLRKLMRTRSQIPTLAPVAQERIRRRRYLRKTAARTMATTMTMNATTTQNWVQSSARIVGRRVRDSSLMFVAPERVGFGIYDFRIQNWDSGNSRDPAGRAF